MVRSETAEPLQLHRGILVILEARNIGKSNVDDDESLCHCCGSIDDLIDFGQEKYH